MDVTFKKILTTVQNTFLTLSVIGLTTTAQAALVGVTELSGPSTTGVSASIISAPAHVLDDVTTNRAQQGFDEAQNVTTTTAHAVDGGSIAAGTKVNSHMIFLNSAGSSLIGHYGVKWEFDGLILGVMSNSSGSMEATSTFELGHASTNYTATFAGSGPAAPFTARGLEGNNGTGMAASDGYLISGSFLTLSMKVTEPGDWIRVVTAANVPEPSSLFLLGLGLLGLGVRANSKKA